MAQKGPVFISELVSAKALGASPSSPDISF